MIALSPVAWAAVTIAGAVTLVVLFVYFTVAAILEHRRRRQLELQDQWRLRQ